MINDRTLVDGFCKCAKVQIVLSGGLSKFYVFRKGLNLE